MVVIAPTMVALAPEVPATPVVATLAVPVTPEVEVTTSLEEMNRSLSPDPSPGRGENPSRPDRGPRFLRRDWVVALPSVAKAPQLLRYQRAIALCGAEMTFLRSSRCSGAGGAVISLKTPVAL